MTKGKTEMMMQTSGPGSKMNVDSIEADKRNEMRNELSIKTRKKKKKKKRKEINNLVGEKMLMNRRR